MKIKSVAGVSCYVKNLGKSVKFYETLGFNIRKRDAKHAAAYSNWFWINLVAADSEERVGYKRLAQGKDRGGGVLLYLSVENVDAFHRFVRSKGLKPAGEPRDWPSGNREFSLSDPDGHHLVFFKKK